MGIFFGKSADAHAVRRAMQKRMEKDDFKFAI